ncbi:hypothetical protein [Shewanella youngdeokensis]|uniref:DUF3015 domain-containing protein n=1 Tax=Shewanella youngdeokensis TaxID=2999068 RepID=A0ABZ0K2G8_9GAMM|nr:hypothetical protein RGE70_08295 [Shewanella sp. DAU334]
MKKVVLAGLVSCLIAGSASAKTLDVDNAIGMASLMICTTYYSENDMQIEGTIVGQSMMNHENAGIKEMKMTETTNKKLTEYMANFKAASKSQKGELCEQAIEFARNSTFVKENS